MQMQYQSSQGGIVRIRQGIDQRMHRVSSHCVVVDSCGIDVLAVELMSEQRVGQFTEEQFQEPRYTIDVVLEGFRVPEINL